MQRYLFITIDTEEDEWGNFSNQDPQLRNIYNIPMLQDIFNKYNAVPTYLINYPVATSMDSVKILKNIYDEEKCEIGTHCHPWNTPPIKEELTNCNSFLCNLPEALIYDKINNLHQEIIKNFDLCPISFRAGRWGFSQTVGEMIRSLNYKIDTSMTPFCDWNKYSGPEVGITNNNAFGFNEKTYLCAKADNCSNCQNDDDCILEIPPTIGFLQSNFILCNKIRNIFMKKHFSKFRIIGILERLKIINYRWLSPEQTSYEEMAKLSTVLLRKGYRFLNMFFHSTSLLPGKSPFVQDKNDLKKFISKIDNYLKFSASKNIACVGLSKALEVLK